MKLKTILTLLAALGILTACNDDFFDQVPDDRITIEQVFQRTSYSEKYLATVYSYIRDESHRTDGVPWDPCSDDLDVTYDREDYNSFKMNLGNWSASSNYYEYWSHYYRGIRSATYFIQHIGSNQEMLDDPTRGPIVVEQYKNEARFLRAWFYYCLLRQYGPCVLLGDEVLPGDLDRDDVKMNLPRSSYDECVDYIVGELDDMIDNNRLPLHFTVQADKDYGRATLAMCMGLKSRVLLLAASDLKTIVSDLHIWKLAAVRMLLIPAVCLAAFAVLGLLRFGMSAQVVLLLECCPAAAITSVFAVQFGHDEQFAAGCVVLTTLLSIVTLPLCALIITMVM